MSGGVHETVTAAQHKTWGRVLISSAAIVLAIASASRSLHGQSPQITKLDIDSSTVTLGNSFTLTVDVSNASLLPSGYGGISVSFPQFTDVGEGVAGDHVYGSRSSDMTYREYERGSSQDSIYTAAGYWIYPDYLLVEAADAYWNMYETNTLILQVTPTETGTFVIYVRTWLEDFFVGDSYHREPSSSAYTDQQGWPVYRVSVDVVQPDLTPTYMSGPSLAAPDETVSLDWTIRNTGTSTATGGWYVDMWLSTNTTITTYDTRVGYYRETQSLPAGNEDVQTGVVTIPSSVACGYYYWGITVDTDDEVPESNESNNSRAGNQVYVCGDPDLVVSAISAPSNARIGETPSVSVSVKNQGTGPASSGGRVDVYLSTNTIISTGDTPLCSVNASGSLPVNDTDQYSVSGCTVPELATGRYYIGAIVDAGGQIAESNEANNESSDVFTPPPFDVDPGANLVAGTPTFTPSSPDTSQAVSVQAQITNSGTGAAGAFNWEFRKGGATVGSGRVNGLGPGGSVNVGPVNLGKLTAGVPTIQLVVDPGAEVAESNEGDNTASNSVTVTLPPPNLVSASVTVSPSSPTTLDTVVASGSIANQGGSASGAFDYGWKLDGTAVAGGRSSGLGTGASISPSASLGQVAAACYTISLVADTLDEVAESNETDNTDTASFCVTAAAPDLDPKAVTGPAVAALGEGISVSVTTQNIGSASAPSGWTGRIYLSADTTITAADTEIGSWNESSSLDENASTTASHSATIPVSQALGTYYVGVIVDATDVLEELDESNNAGAGDTIQVRGPNLTLGSVSATPSNPSTLDQVTVQAPVSNTGDAGAGGFWWALKVDGQTRQDGFVSGLAVSASQTLSATVGPLSQGLRTLQFVVDTAGNVPESDEGDNTDSTTVTVVQPPPDLVPDTIAVPDTLVRGDTFVVTIGTANQGDGAAASGWTGQIYLSSNDVISSSDDTIGTFTENQVLAPNSRYTTDRTASIPIGTAPGTYYIGVILDATDAIAESDNNNNTLAAAHATVVVTRPNLTPSAVHVLPANPTTLDTVRVVATIENTGGSTAGAFTWSYSLDGEVVHAGRVTSLPAGSTAVLDTLSLGVLPADSHTVRVVADTLDEVWEEDETDNTLSAGFSVTVPPPDLVAALAGPAAAVAGESPEYTVTIRNVGDGVADGLGEARLYLSTDAAIDTAADMLKDATVRPDTLAPGDSLSYTVQLALDITLDGTYYPGIVVDATDSVAESDETNNTTVGAALAVTAAPDLVARPPTTTPAVPTTIDSFDVTGVVRNTGGSPASFAWELSLDGQVLVTGSTIGLAAGDSTVLRANDNAPLPRGPHVIMLEVDTADAVREPDESNNRDSTSLNVPRPADLTVQAVTGPTTAPLGASIDVDVALTNEGETLAPDGWTGRVYLSVDTLLDANDITIGSFPGPALAPGAADTASNDHTVPDTITTGSYHVVVQLDALDDVAEDDEDDNVAVAAAVLEVTRRPLLALDRDSLHFQVLEGDDPTYQDTFVVRNDGEAVLHWSVSGEPAWLSAQPDTGALAAGQADTVVVSVGSAALAVDTYTVSLLIDDPAADSTPQNVVVSLAVIERALIVPSAESLKFSTMPGTDPDPDTLLVSNAGGATLNWTASHKAGWLTLDPVSGATDAGAVDTVEISLDVAGLAADTYEDTIVIADPVAEVTSDTVIIRLIIGQPVLSLSRDTVELHTYAGAPAIADSFRVANRGGGAMAWTAAADSTWVGLDPGVGSLPGEDSATVVVTINPTPATVGDYFDFVVVTAPTASASPDTVTVVVHVDSVPIIAAVPDTVRFRTLEGSDPADRELTITNAGGWQLDWAATPDSTWLSVQPESGSLASGEADTLAVSVVAAARAAGSDTATITVVDTLGAADTVTVPVILTVEARPLVDAEPNTLPFRARLGTGPVTGRFTVTNAGGDTLRWTATADVDWIMLAPDTGTTASGTDSVNVTVRSDTLAIGSYTGAVEVADTAAGTPPDTVAVTLDVVALPGLIAVEDTIRFDAAWGVHPAAQVVHVTNTGGDTLQWTGQPDSAWINVEPDSGAVPAADTTAVTVSIDVSSLNPGSYASALVFEDSTAAESPDTVHVVLDIAPRPIASVTPDTLEFYAVEGSLTEPQTLEVRNAGTGTLQWLARSHAAWIGLEPDTGSVDGDGADTVTVTLADTVPGDYEAFVLVEDSAAGTVDTALVKLHVETKPAVAAEPDTLWFNVLQNGTVAGEYFTVQNTGGDTLRWSATTDTPWLELAPDTGSAPAGPDTVVVTILDTSLAVGRHTGTIVVRDSAADPAVDTVIVVFDVIERPQIAVTPASLDTIVEQGHGPVDTSLIVTNAGGDTLRWTVTATVPWITVAPDTGSVPPEADTLSVSLRSDSLAVGIHSGWIRFTDPEAVNSPDSILVTVRVLKSAELVADSSSLTFEGMEDRDPEGRTFTITNTGEVEAGWSIRTSAPWLSIEPTSSRLGGAETQQINAQAHVAGLAPDTFNDTIWVVWPDAGGDSASIGVTFDLEPAPSMPAADSVAGNCILDLDQDACTPEQRQYLDYVGNRNGVVDVGDFQAWLRLHPEALSAAPAIGRPHLLLDTVPEAGKPPPPANRPGQGPGS